MDFNVKVYSKVLVSLQSQFLECCVKIRVDLITFDSECDFVSYSNLKFYIYAWCWVQSSCIQKPNFFSHLAMIAILGHGDDFLLWMMDYFLLYLSCSTFLFEHKAKGKLVMPASWNFKRKAKLATFMEASGNNKF